MTRQVTATLRSEFAFGRRSAADRRCSGNTQARLSVNSPSLGERYVVLRLDGRVEWLAKKEFAAPQRAARPHGKTHDG